MQRRHRVIGSFLTGFALLLAAFPSAAGTISGTVRYEGKIPKLKKQDMRADAGCVAKHATPPASDMLVLGEGNTVGNVFVRLKSGVPEQEYAVPAEPAVLDQIGCRFLPRVLGVRVGQELKILNSDTLMHNVHTLSELNMPFNLAMPASMTETIATFTEEEWMIRVKCDVHPWMGAYLAVLKHPFFDATGPDGTFRISGVPAGTYEVEVWHEALGTLSAEVSIGADETKSTDFTMSPPSKKRRR